MRSYAHFALPVPYLSGTEIEWLDAIVARERDWAPAQEADGERICVTRTWVGPHAGELRLVVLGFYPVLATVGDAAGERRAAQRVIGRIVERVRAAGGQEVADEDLAQWVAGAADRWDQVREAERLIARMQLELEFGQCAVCDAFTSRDAPSCHACGHRFGGAERAEQEQRREDARKAIEEARARHEAVSRGAMPAAGGVPALGGAP